MNHQLSCGTKLSELSELSDAHAGVNNALPPLYIKQLENHLETCAECRSTLKYLEQLSVHAQESQQEQESSEANDKSWLQNLLGSLVLETKHGKNIPMQSKYDNGKLDQSEGAVRSLIRSYASSPEVLVVSTKLRGEITKPNAPCEVDAHLHVALNHRIPHLAEKTREKIWHLLRLHTDLNIQAVNLYVDDLADQEEIREIQNAHLRASA